MPDIQHKTQRERKATSDRCIYEAAVGLFADQGFTRTTLHQIGDRSGYSGGLVSSRYGSKENLLKQVLLHIASHTKQLLEDAPPHRKEPGTHHYIKSVLNSDFLNHPEVRALYVIMGEALGALPTIQDDIANYNEQEYHHLRAIIQADIASRRYNLTRNVPQAAAILHATMRGIIEQYLANPEDTNIGTQARCVTKFMDTLMIRSVD